MLERKIEKRLYDKVKKHGGLALKLNTTTMNGMPDRLVLLPGGRAVFVELKQTGAKPRRAQIKRHEQLRRLGFAVAVIDDTEQIGGLLDGV